MVVSMIQIRIEIPDLHSLKEKRRVVKSLKDRIEHRYRVSVAEVDLQDSLKFAQLGAAKVSHSKTFGESIMHKILTFIEKNVQGRLIDVKIRSAFF